MVEIRNPLIKGRESWRKAQRLLDFSHQRTAARLLPDERVCGCRWAVISRQHGVEVALTTYEDGAQRARFSGLQVCGSVWLCPCCGKRISEVRRGELNALLAWARSVGLVPVMLTLTARHRRGNDLGQQLAGMKKAKRLMRQRREWRAIKSSIVGTVTATEVTHGGAGWHTHFHEIALIRAADETDALRMFSEWPRSGGRVCGAGHGRHARAGPHGPSARRRVVCREMGRGGGSRARRPEAGAGRHDAPAASGGCA